VGRTLGANRLLAGSACGKRRRGRPLNRFVSVHMRMVRPSVATFCLCWSASFALLLWFTRGADAAMDKSGMGDLAKWELLNQRADIAFGVCLAIWVVAFVRSLIPGREQLQFLVACGVTGSVAVVLWVASFPW
jgi:hypothetical protein